MGTLKRRELIGGALGIASVGVAVAGQPNPEEKTAAKSINLGDWAIKHGGDCPGCAGSVDVGQDEFKIICNECGRDLDVMVGEIAFKRLVEALGHARHALVSSSGLMAHDGKPEHAFPLDFAKQVQAIDEALKLADVEPRMLPPLEGPAPMPEGYDGPRCEHCNGWLPEEGEFRHESNCPELRKRLEAARVRT